MVGCKSSGARPKSERWPYESNVEVEQSSRLNVHSGDSPSEVVRESRDGSERRGAQVGGRSRCIWRRKKRSRKTSARCSEDGQSPVQSLPCAIMYGPRSAMNSSQRPHSNRQCSSWSRRAKSVLNSSSQKQRQQHLWSRIDALILERDSAHAHFGSSRSRNVAQQSELRVEECVGHNHSQGWRSGGSGHRSTHFIRDGGANGRHNEVSTDGCVDPFSGCEETMLASRFKPCVSIFSREPSLNETRYGLRGVRVGEASNPGPQSRVRTRCGEEAPEDVLFSLEFDVDSTTFADFPPTVVDSAQQQSTVWPDAKVQSSSESGITSVH